MKLLFADPSKSFQQIIATMFAETDLEIGFADTGESAMRMAVDGWQFICMAAHLPDGDGLTLCRQLRALPAYLHTPIILFTSDTSENIQRQASQAGATEVFLKSNISDLINFVSRYSARVKKFSGRVLYVEDSPSQALVMQALLAAQGLSVEWCSSGEEAWDVLQIRKYDLLLTDLVLAGAMSGSALISRVRSSTGERGDTPIIAVTAFDHLSRRIELFHLGVNDYVAKPIVEEELISRVRNLVERRTAEQSLKRLEKRRFDETLIYLSRSLNTLAGDISAALAEICQKSAEVLEVDRAGIWTATGDGAKIHCRTFYEKGEPPSEPMTTLAREDFPIYFAAMMSERSIAADNALTHPATSELIDYLSANGIGAMLDVPFGPAGKRSGVICHEHIGSSRKWRIEEESFAAAVGDLVTLAFEAHERSLADQQLRLAGLVFEAASEAIVICNRDNVIVSANDAFSEITGRSRTEVIGKTPSLFKSGRHDKQFYIDMWHALETQNKWQGEIWDRKSDGSEFLKRLTISRVLNATGEVSNYIAVFTDISQEKADQAQLHYLAYNDVLTDLPNRVYAETTLTNALSAAERRGSHLALLCIDLDRFKKINSSFGHAKGDTLLKEAAQRIQGALGRESHLARWSGAGFVTILEAPADAELAITMAQRCMDAFRLPFTIGQSELQVTLSIGIGLYPQHGHAPADLIKNTVTALSRAKDNGGNRYVFFNNEMEQRTVERLLLESRLSRAIAQNQFVVHYQPKVDARTLKPVGMEALVRWNDPVEGLILPGRFIGLAEDNGQIYPINHWVLHESCRQTAEWHRNHGLSLPVAVNLPAGSFAQGDVAQEIRRCLADTGLPPALLELELTESAMMDDPQRAIEVFSELKQIGVRIAIDDFGTGYSSLAYLRRFPIDILKIDRSFITNLNASEDELVIVSSIIGLAKSLKLKTIAEGIERDVQGAILRDLGCDMFQGYLFGRPVPPDEFLTQVAKA